jgi:hypothetical protein
VQLAERIGRLHGRAPCHGVWLLQVARLLSDQSDSTHFVGSSFYLRVLYIHWCLRPPKDRKADPRRVEIKVLTKDEVDAGLDINQVVRAHTKMSIHIVSVILVCVS